MEVKMGNRAVIVDKETTKENADKKLGVYLHWYGSEDSVKEFLNVCKERKIRSVLTDSQYGWARLCQAFADCLSDVDIKAGYKDYAYETGIGIGLVSGLDCANGDNGVYYIDENFDIVNHTDGKELEDEK